MLERFEVFTMLITKASRYIHRLKTKEMAEFNLKSSHVSCLYYLFKRNSLTAKELCGLCGEDKANVSRTIKHLENSGLIYCESTAQKRYQTAFYLTEKGKQVGLSLVEKIDNVLSQSSVGISEQNRQIFYDSLALICNNLEKLCNYCDGDEKND